MNLNLDETKGYTPLVIIDGIESTTKKMRTLDPNKISEINILKDQVAIKAYGDKGKNGVIIVKTKKH